MRFPKLSVSSVALGTISTCKRNSRLISTGCVVRGSLRRSLLHPLLVIAPSSAWIMAQLSLILPNTGSPCCLPSAPWVVPDKDKIHLLCG